MATSSRVTIGMTPTPIGVSDSDGIFGSSILIRNRGTDPIYIGDSGVTAGTGYQLDPGEAMASDLTSKSLWYAVTASGAVVCHVLQSGV